MPGPTPLGTFHAAISLIAVAAGFAALAREGRISTRSAAGLTFFGGTLQALRLRRPQRSQLDGAA